MSKDPAARKIRCIFDTEGEGTRNYRALATVRASLLEDMEKRGLEKVDCTVKIDGTAAKVVNGALEMRRDVKVGRPPPKGWHSVLDEPDSNGHYVGFYSPLLDPKEVKLHKHSLTAIRQHILSRNFYGLFIHMSPEGDLYSEFEPLNSYEGATVEVIGPMLQGDKYQLSQHPVKHRTKLIDEELHPPDSSLPTSQHYLVLHGELTFGEITRDQLTYEVLREMVDKAQVEGVVLHLPAVGEHPCVYYKAHRGHLNLQWPVEQAKLHPLERR